MEQCTHPESALRYRTYKNGALHFFRQCVICGEATTDAIPHISISENEKCTAEKYDETAKQKWESARHAAENERRYAERVGRFRAKETEYGGRRFRSRIEARWAVFMDALSVKFEYERECYELGEFNYLPDFWVPIIGAHIEIKPEPPTNDEECKATRLAEFTGKPVYIFVGSPAIPDWCSDDNAYAYFPSGCVDVQYYWCECPKCHQIGVEFNGRSDRIACKCVKGGDKGYNHDSIRLRQAYAKATGYRFEPGAINP